MRLRHRLISFLVVRSNAPPLLSFVTDMSEAARQPSPNTMISFYFLQKLFSRFIDRELSIAANNNEVNPAVSERKGEKYNQFRGNVFRTIPILKAQRQLLCFHHLYTFSLLPFLEVASSAIAHSSLQATKPDRRIQFSFQFSLVVFALRANMESK